MSAGTKSLIAGVETLQAPQIVTLENAPPNMTHIASFSETAALCGAELDASDGAWLGTDKDVCCVVCAELWHALTFSERVSLSQFWGGGTHWQSPPALLKDSDA